MVLFQVGRRGVAHRLHPDRVNSRTLASTLSSSSSFSPTTTISYSRNVRNEDHDQNTPAEDIPGISRQFNPTDLLFTL